MCLSGRACRRGACLSSLDFGLDTACENLEIFGSRKFVVAAFAFYDIDAFPEEFQDARFVGRREVEWFRFNARVKRLEQVDAGCLRRLGEPDFAAVDGAFDFAVDSDFNCVDGGLCHEATAFALECYANFANDFFAYERACHIVNQNVFSAARECVDSVLYGLPAFGTTDDDF